jgi:hypothetical protein
VDAFKIHHKCADDEEIEVMDVVGIFCFLKDLKCPNCRSASTHR